MTEYRSYTGSAGVGGFFGDIDIMDPIPYYEVVMRFWTSFSDRYPLMLIVWLAASIWLREDFLAGRRIPNVNGFERGYQSGLDIYLW